MCSYSSQDPGDALLIILLFSSAELFSTTGFTNPLDALVIVFRTKNGDGAALAATAHANRVLRTLRPAEGRPRRASGGEQGDGWSKVMAHDDPLLLGAVSVGDLRGSMRLWSNFDF
jgi:hypothetical protein